MINGIIDLENEESDETFHEKLNHWIIENGWKNCNARAVKVPNNTLLTAQVGAGSAVFHPDYKGGSSQSNENKRYFLSRTWNPTLPIMTTFMMNPSSANELSGDETVNFMVQFAKYNDYGSLWVVNTSPVIKGSNAVQSDFQIDKYNWYYIEYAINNSDSVILGWGEKGQKYGVPLLKANYPLEELMERNHFKLKVFGYGKENNRAIYPKHPRPQMVNQRFPIDHELIDITEEKCNAILR